MTVDIHDRARRLLRESLIAGISADDQRWLTSHMAECETCSRGAAQLQSVIGEMKSAPLMANPVLVTRTRAIVRARSVELNEQRNRMRLLLISCAMDVVLLVVFGPYLWHMAGWLTETVSIPFWTSALVVVWFWTVPAVIAMAVALAHRQSTIAVTAE